MVSCDDDECDPMVDCPPTVDTAVVYTQTPYTLNLPAGIPNQVIPADNPLTEEGVLLGRMLFYDPILSGDSTQSCSSCHLQKNAFTDPRQFSPGIDGNLGKRNSMPLFNLSFGLNTRFTWDGNAPDLEAQALEPIENPIEMHHSVEGAVERLKNHLDYPLLFGKAFNEEPSDETLSKSLSQFMRSIVSFNSQWDRWTTQGSGDFVDLDDPSDSLAWYGFTQVYNLETGLAGEAECIHCHGGIFFTEFSFKNNGLTDTDDAFGFPDLGLGGITGDAFDNGLFKVPTLRNIALTAPYMHDGRFETLEEVVDHYSAGGHFSPTLSSELGSPFTSGEAINLSPGQKAALIAFLKSLTDSTLINNPAYSSPF